METYHKDSQMSCSSNLKCYDRAIKEINRDIERMFENYAKGNDLTPSKAKRLLNIKIPNPLMEWLKKKLPTVKNEKIKKLIIQHIESKAYGARITRLEALKESIYLNLATVADVELRECEKLYTNTINKAYYLNCFNLKKAFLPALM